MLLLLVVHLAELPEFILLKDAECSKIRCPLSSKIFHLFIKLRLRCNIILHIIYPSILISLSTLADRDESAHSCPRASARSANRYPSSPRLILKIATSSVARALIKYIWRPSRSACSTIKLLISEPLLCILDLNLLLLRLHFILLNPKKLWFFTLLQMLENRNPLICGEALDVWWSYLGDWMR